MAHSGFIGICVRLYRAQLCPSNLTRDYYAFAKCRQVLCFLAILAISRKPRKLFPYFLQSGLHGKTGLPPITAR